MNLLQYPISNGVVIVGMDAHYWPGKRTTAHKAFVEWVRDLEPKAVILNGDVIDASTISRHPPIGWENHPSLEEELNTAQERLAEIEAASPDSDFIWPLGNHDARFETKIASIAPEYRGVKGVHLKDHFPNWRPVWGVEVGGPQGIVIKHRFKGGAHAAYNNAVSSGRSILTGHLHRLSVIPYTDYTGTRYGVEGGMLGDPSGPQFMGYTEGNPLNWRAGFIVLTFAKGRLLVPETVSVDPNRKNVVEFRGEEFTV